MIQIKDNVISLNKARQLTPQQKAKLELLEGNRKTNYLLSLLGVTKERVYTPSLAVRGHDMLRQKTKDSILSKMFRLKDVTRDHLPGDVVPDTSTGHWIGVELECIIPGSDFGDECTDDCDHDNGECYSRPDRREAHRWLSNQLKRAGVTRTTVKDDGSLDCDEGGIGVECTILFNSKHGFDPLIKLCKALQDAGCYVNKTCGLHVHLDARHLKKSDVGKIGRSIGNAIPILKWMLPESRHNNNYCKLDVSGLTGARYYAVNLTAFKKYKTIEVRMHQGSLNASKIINWIKLLKFLSDARLKHSIYYFQELLDLGLSDELAEYVESRITELNPTEWKRLTHVEFSAWPRVTQPMVSAA